YVNSENCGLKPALNYIVGGERAVRNEFPFLVIIKLNGNTVCGGAIINDIWVITAAHCFKDREHQIADYSVHAGAHSLHDGEEYRLQLIRVHSKFSFGEMNSDVCLIKMDRNFNFGPHVGPVCLPMIQRAEVSGVITVAGWGRLIEKGTPSKILQKVNLPIITDEQCSSMYQDKAVVIFRSHFCTYLEGYDTCEVYPQFNKGDSGGPAFQFQNGRFTLIGIVSFGWECADTHPVRVDQKPRTLDSKYIFHIRLCNHIESCHGLNGISLPECGLSRRSYHRNEGMGGKEAKRGQFPWIVSLQMIHNTTYKYHICGGAILNHFWIVTAAHCVQHRNNFTHILQIRFGSVNWTYGYESEISRIVCHPFNTYHIIDDNEDNFADIALIRVTKPIRMVQIFGYYLVNSICLPHKGQKFNGVSTLAGWGQVRYLHPNTQMPVYNKTQMLHKADNMPIVSLDKCKISYAVETRHQLNRYIDENIICSGGNQMGSSSGDSGGPLVYYNDSRQRAIIIGVASMAEPCFIYQAMISHQYPEYVNSENCGLKPALNYIVGGERAVRNEFPFLVIIKLNGNTVCGGAIIDDIWVITAAHCFKDREHQIADYSVHAGAHSLRDGEEYRLQLIRVHSKFSFGEMNSDVCLIKMDRNFNFGPHVGPVCLPIIQRAEVSGVITVAGWGRLIEKGTPSKILQKVNLPIITDEQCASMYQDKAVVIFRSHFCTYLEGYDTC
ncbi:unnamed protein product, partial [Oppiella nova]